MLGAVAQAGGPWLIGRAIDRYILPGDLAGLSRIMLLLFGVYVMGAIVSRGQVYQVGSIGQSLLASMRARIFDRLQHLPLRYFDRRPVGDLMSRVTNDVDTLNQLFSQGLTQLLGSLFSLIGIVVAMLFLNWNLALACFTIIPIMLLLTSFFARRARRAFRLTRETVGDVTAGAQEDITGVREAQAFNRTEENIVRFRRRNAANRDANVQAVAITSAFSPAIDVLSTLATALVIGYGGYLVFAGSLSVGVLTAFLIYVQQFFRPIQLASQVYTQAQAAVAGAERIYNILDEEPEPADPPNAGKLGPARGRISFQHVTFAYDPGRPVLHDVDFVVEPGQTVALVGPTGAGKTTIASLIPRFYDATEGAVRIDGRDVREMARKNLRANIGIVLQEPFLFSGTISENIGYGRSGDPAEATPRGGRGCGPRGQRPRLYHGSAGRLRYRAGRGRRGAQPGPAPAPLFRQGGPDGPAHPHTGRGHEQHRHAHGGDHPAGAGDAPRRQDQRRDRAPPEHHQERRPHPRSSGRPHRGAWHPRLAHGEERPLRGPLPPTVPRARLFRQEDPDQARTGAGG